MSQHDLNIANQGFPAFRADLNDALVALGSTNSGATAPATTYANQLWYDTANNILKIRNEDNDAWISIVTVDQSTDAVTAIGSLTLADIVSLTGSQTLTNKTLTNPTINGFTGNTAVVNIGSAQFYKDTSGNIGIGTSTLNAKTQIVASDKGLAVGTSSFNPATGTMAQINSSGNSSSETILALASLNDGIRAKFLADGQFQFNSGFGSAATAFGCRSWVNFTGTGATPTINASGNVSSISDLGTGHYVVTFINNFPDAGGVAFNSADIGGWTAGRNQIAGMASNGYQLRFWNASGTETDPSVVYSAAIR
jgi:hypothetical protein